MSEKIVLRDVVTGEYLAEKLFKGYFLTPDLMKALKCKDEEDARGRLQKQNVKSADAFVMDKIEIS